jgi:hypothetical protein
MTPYVGYLSPHETQIRELHSKGMEAPAIAKALYDKGVRSAVSTYSEARHISSIAAAVKNLLDPRRVAAPRREMQVRGGYNGSLKPHLDTIKSLYVTGKEPKEIAAILYNSGVRVRDEEEGCDRHFSDRVQYLSGGRFVRIASFASKKEMMASLAEERRREHEPEQITRLVGMVRFVLGLDRPRSPEYILRDKAARRVANLKDLLVKAEEDLAAAEEALVAGTEQDP